MGGSARAAAAHDTPGRLSAVPSAPTLRLVVQSPQPAARHASLRTQVLYCIISYLTVPSAILQVTVIDTLSAVISGPVSTNRVALASPIRVFVTFFPVEEENGAENSAGNSRPMEMFPAFDSCLGSVNSKLFHISADTREESNVLTDLIAQFLCPTVFRVSIKYLIFRPLKLYRTRNKYTNCTYDRSVLCRVD